MTTKTNPLWRRDSAYAKTRRSFDKKGISYVQQDNPDTVVLVSTDKRMPKLRATFTLKGDLVKMES